MLYKEKYSLSEDIFNRVFNNPSLEWFMKTEEDIETSCIMTIHLIRQGVEIDRIYLMLKRILTLWRRNSKDTFNIYLIKLNKKRIFKESEFKWFMRYLTIRGFCLYNAIKDWKY